MMTPSGTSSDDGKDPDPGTSDRANREYQKVEGSVADSDGLGEAMTGTLEKPRGAAGQSATQAREAQLQLASGGIAIPA